MFHVCHLCRRAVHRLCTRRSVGNVLCSPAFDNNCVNVVQDGGNMLSRHQCHSLKTHSALLALAAMPGISQHQTGPKQKGKCISTNTTNNRAKSESYRGALQTVELRALTVSGTAGAVKLDASAAGENAQKAQRPISQTTIDEEEVSKFSRLADLWWDEAGEFEALHSMNELRVPLIRDVLIAQRQQESSSDAGVSSPLPLDGCRVLDVGSGGGILSEPLARLGASVVGVDASEENIKIAQAHMIHEPKVARSVKYIQSTVEDLVATESGSFDAVVVSEVVEHVADVPTFVTACCQLVKPGGSIFLTTLNKTYLSYALGVVGAENFLQLVPPGTHDWNKFISPQDLQYNLDQNDFSTRLLHGLKYNPLTKRWSWMKNTSINYAIHAVRPHASHTGNGSQ